MTRHYDTPPPPSPLDCVRYVQESVALSSGEPFQQRVFVFDFSRFTPAVMLGGNTKRWDKGALHGADLYGTLQSIPLGNLARWVYQQKQSHWRDDGLTNGEVEPLVEALVASFERDGLNDDAMLDAIGRQGGFIDARLPEDHPGGPDAPVMLRLLDEGLDGFVAWWKHEDKLLRQRRVEDECQAMNASLGVAVRSLRRARARQRSVRDKLAQTASALKTGAVALEMVEMFAKPPSERPSSWRSIEPVDWHKDFVKPAPDAAWRDRYRIFRSDWHKSLLGSCASAMRPKSLRDEIDVAANLFVDELRDPGAPYLELLRQWDTLLPGSRAVLRTTLHLGFEGALLSESARERLAAGELSKLAQLAASHPTPPAPKGASASGQRLLEEIDAFDASVLEPDLDTPLAQWMSETYLSAKDLSGHGLKILDILALGTPFITRRLESMDRGSKYLSSAWAWVALVGTCELAPRKAETFLDFTGGDLVDWKLFDRKDGGAGEIRALVGKADGVWKFANVLARTVHLRYALAEVESASTEEQQIKALEALESFFQVSRAVMEISGLEVPSRLLLSLKSGGKALNIVAVAGVLADAATLAVAYAKYRHIQTKRRTTKAKEDAQLELAFEILAFTVSAIGLVVGAEFIILGLVIVGVKTIVMDLDTWMPATEYFTGIQSKPGVHRYLEGVLEGLYNSDEFHGMIDELGTPEAEVLRLSVEEVWRKLSPAPMATTQQMWDLGGRPDSNLSYPARNIARKHWGADNKTLAQVIRPCRH